MIFIGKGSIAHPPWKPAGSSYVIRKARNVALLMALLLMLVAFTHAGRSTPRFLSNKLQCSEVPFQDYGREPKEDNEKCEGLSEEECLMRRSLLAHTDYIYTQKLKP